MPRFPATQDQPVLGPVKVVPPQGLAALRGLHLDRVRAPAVTWQLTEAGQSKISSNQVSTLSGEPRTISRHASRNRPTTRRYCR